MKKIRVGIVGCGKIGLTNTRAITETGLYEVTYLCDVEEQRIENFREHLNDETIKGTTDYRKLVESTDVDAVMIFTPTYLHCEQACAAINCNKHVFIEKPIGINIEEIDSLIELAAKSDVKVSVGLELHHMNLHHVLQKKVNSKSFGGTKFIVVSEHRENFKLPWFYDKNKSGGAINDKMIHHFDLTNSFFYPSRPRYVYASGGKDVYSENFKIKVLDTVETEIEKSSVADNATVIVDYEDDKNATYTLNMYGKEPVEGMQVYIAGLNGNYIRVLEANSSASQLLIQEENKKETMWEIADKTDTDSRGLGHPGNKREFEAFADCIKNNKESITNLWQARTAQIIALASEESILTHKKVDLKNYENKKLESLAVKKNWLIKPTYNNYTLKRIARFSDIDNQRKLYFIDRLFLGTRSIFALKDKTKFNKRKTRLMIKEIVKNINNNQELLSELKGIRKVFKFKIVTLTFYITIGENIQYSSIKPKSDNMVSVSIDRAGWNGILRKKSIAYLYFSRKIKVKGDLQDIQGSVNFFENLLNQIYLYS